MENKKNKLIRGAFWTIIFSLIGIPLSLYVNWLLGFFDNDGISLGKYALIIIYINAVTTFVLCGGANVITNFLPKISENEEKGKFMFTYLLLCSGLLLVYIFVLAFIPKITDFILGVKIHKIELISLFCLSPFIMLSQIVIFNLQGRMEFKKAAIFNQLQVFFLSVFLTFFYFIYRDLFVENGIVVFSTLFMIIYLIIFLVGIKKTTFQIGFYWNKNIMSFVFYSFFNTLNTFLFANIDKIIILKYIGLKEVGIYYVLLQISMLVKFLTLRIGQVLLSSFSSYISTNNIGELKVIYKNTCEYVVFLSTFLSFILIIGASFFNVVFGELYDTSSSIMLIVLIVGINITNVGSINSMLVLAKEKNRAFFVSNLILILVQLITTLLLIKSYGIWAVIIGKFLGYISGQIGLFIIVYKLNLVQITRGYVVSQFFVILIGIIGVCSQLALISWLIGVVCQFILIYLYFKTSGLNNQKIVNTIKIFSKKNK